MIEKGKHYIAVLINFIGIKPNISTGICDGTTYGYGKLSDLGYWEYMLKIEYEK